MLTSYQLGNIKALLSITFQTTQYLNIEKETNRLKVATLGNRRSEVEIRNEIYQRTEKFFIRRIMVKLIRAQGGCLGTKSR